MDITLPLTFLAVDITEEFVGAFVAFWVLIGMFIVLMLPVLAIPYIFVKMGSIAGKVQGKLNSWGRGARNTAMGSAKRAAKDQYKNSGFAQARQMRKESRGIERRRRALNGEGIGGALFNAEGKLAGRIPRTAGQAAGDRLMRERIEAVQRKERDERIANAQSNLTPNAALSLSGGTPVSPLNAADDAAIKYMHDSGIAAEPELRSRALGTFLNQNGFMTADVNKKLVESAGDASTEEGRLARAKVNDALNIEASKGGQYQYSYNSVDAAGNFKIAGQKGTTVHEGIRGIIMSKGIAAMPKELYADKAIEADVQSAIQDLYTDPNTVDQFMRGTLSLSKGKEVEGVAKMLGMNVVDFEAERQKYADKYKGG